MVRDECDGHVLVPRQAVGEIPLIQYGTVWSAWLTLTRVLVRELVKGLNI